MIQANKTQNILSFGERLKKAREDAGFSVEQLAVRTKIQRKYLERLEAEEFDALPPPVYVRGFVKHWAEACNADKPELLDQFDRINEFFLRARQGEKRLGMPASSFVITSRPIFYFLGGVAALIITAFFGYQYFILAKQPRIDIFSPQAMEIIVHDQQITITGHAQYAARLTIAGKNANIGRDGNFSIDISLNDGVNTIYIKGSGYNGQSVEVMRKIIRVSE
ncbi:MAG: helix-turn-helix domain-containing protein [Candidatus Spechtbacteria bacterium]|nr:helix-turn-helix domain-containing protein [Candidatus Spechtbacteria bacterium]